MPIAAGISAKPHHSLRIIILNHGDGVQEYYDFRVEVHLRYSFHLELYLHKNHIVYKYFEEMFLVILIAVLNFSHDVTKLNGQDNPEQSQ